MREDTQVDPLPVERAQKALQSSRAFLRLRLVPDVERVQRRIAQLDEDRRRYTAFSLSLQRRMAQGTNATRKEEEQTLAPLGSGVHVPVRVNGDEMLLVSMGLAKASETARSIDSSSAAAAAGEMSQASMIDDEKDDAGLYVELTADEALAFSVKKIAILEKKSKLAREREALIQGHIELTSKSIEQLEALQQNPSANFLDFL